MTIIEQIKAEIERRKGICMAQIKANPGQTFPFVMEMTGYDKILSFLSTLESEKPMNPEGLEKEISMVLDDVDHEFFPVDPGEELSETDFINSLNRVARHFAQWGAEHLADARKMIEPPCHTVDEWIEHIMNADQLTKDIFSKGPYDVLYDALNHPYQHCYDAIKEFGELCYASGLQDKQEHSLVSNDLEEAAIQYATHKKKSEEEEMETELPMGAYYLAKDSFIAGYNLCKEQMLKEAEECYYGYVNNCTKVFLPEKTLKGIKEGYVKIVILKNDE